MRLRKLLPRAIRKHLNRMLRRGAPEKAGPPGTRDAPGEFGPVRRLSSAPPVFLSGISKNAYLGIARAFARRYGNLDAGFIVFPTWSLEQSRTPQAIQRALAIHAERNPGHRFLLICNTPAETLLLQGLGLRAVFLNKNFMVSERIFRPIPDCSVEFDAVYNARFIPAKRHELVSAVPRVGYIAYIESNRDQEFRQLYAGALARSPHHVLLNEQVDGLPVRMSHEQVNAALGRAAVGLVLSEVEGSSYASMEYLLAGLPVVSTPSKGGRDVFFDPEYCIVCDPAPAAVRDAVDTLRARNIPREYIRARTLARIQPERARFLRAVDDLVEELGGHRRFQDRDWPFGDESGVAWRTFKEHLADFAASQRAELEVEFGLKSGVLANVQLEAGEIRPIVTAIRDKPGCNVLVFGCGNDAPFWESVNRGGTTAFLEDDPAWAAKAQAALASAIVHPVRYDTRVAEWRRLLDRPSELAMELPAEIGSRRWDVIIVDGPAGFDDTQPGRMKSIYAASRLVAPAGRIFVHDCQRPAEQAFASRYLGDHRLFVEARGRAVLKGYAF